MEIQLTFLIDWNTINFFKIISTLKLYRRIVYWYRKNRKLKQKKFALVIASPRPEEIFADEKQVSFMSLEIVRAKKCLANIDFELRPLVRQYRRYITLDF